MTKRLLLIVSIIANIYLLNAQTADFEINSENSSFCLNDTVIFENLSENYDYLLWDFGDGYQTYFENPKHLYLQSGIFTVILTAFMQTGESNSISKQISINPLPTLDLDPGFDTLIVSGSTIDITATGNFDNILWSTGDTENIISVSSQGIYVCEVWSSETGCISTDSVYVSLSDENAGSQNHSLVLNNILSPNNDGINDYLLLKEPENLDANIELSIFNRFGNLLFLDTDYSNNWSGTDSAGNILAVGTYYFILKINKQIIESGFIDILR